jgi:hypothetical protein
MRGTERCASRGHCMTRRARRLCQGAQMLSKETLPCPIICLVMKPLDRIVFAIYMLILALAVAPPLWCILSSRSTLYFVLYMALDNFIALPTPRSISWWAILKALFVCTYTSCFWPSVRNILLHHLVARLRFGFRDKEVIFRKPRPGSNPSVNCFQESLSRAIDPNFLAKNTGIGTQVDFWILDYAAAEDATAGLRSGIFEEDTWKTTVWVKDDLRGWVAHEIWKPLDLVCGPRFMVLIKVPHVSKLAISQWLSIKLQDKITAAGKAEIYDLWISLLGPAVATMKDNPFRRNQKIEEVSKTFLAQHGIDYVQMREEVMHELRQTTKYVNSIYMLL